MNLLALVLAFVGLAMLCLSLRRHRQHLAARAPAPAAVRAMQALSWPLLVLSMLTAIHVYGTSIGVAVWLGLLSIATLAVGLLLSYRPQLLAALGPALVLALLRGVLPGGR
jgi:hypothetical protein